MQNGDVATGKYKLMVSQQKASLTHPNGNLRKEIVEYGRERTGKLLSEGKYHGIDDLLAELPYFIYSHYEELQNDWDRIDLEKELTV